MGANPTRQPLQPEAIGAVMEVTKWLKPSISVSRIGDSASVQAVTSVARNRSVSTFQDHKATPAASVAIRACQRPRLIRSFPTAM